jgi:hypothetical protein
MSAASVDVYVHDYESGEESKVTLREGQPMPDGAAWAGSATCDELLDELKLRLDGGTRDVVWIDTEVRKIMVLEHWLRKLIIGNCHDMAPEWVVTKLLGRGVPVHVECVQPGKAWPWATTLEDTFEGEKVDGLSRAKAVLTDLEMERRYRGGGAG